MMKSKILLCITNLCFVLFAIYYIQAQSKREHELRSIEEIYKSRFNSIDTLEYQQLMNSLKNMHDLIDESIKIGSDSVSIFLEEHHKIGRKYFDFRNNIEDEIEILKLDINETEKAARLLLIICGLVFSVNLLYSLGVFGKNH